MPPHCDAMDGPVVRAARRALDAGLVELVLPYVPETAEEEVRAAFARALPVRELGEQAAEVADRLVFETVVRLHRAGEGAPYAGLKPAGLDVGPAIPLAEAAITSGSAGELMGFLSGVLEHELTERLGEVGRLASLQDRSVADARRYVSAMLGYQVYCHHLLQAIRAPAHGHPAAVAAAD